MTCGMAGRLVPLSFHGFAFVEVVRGTRLGHLPSWGPHLHAVCPQCPSQRALPHPYCLRVDQNCSYFSVCLLSPSIFIF